MDDREHFRRPAHRRIRPHPAQALNEPRRDRIGTRRRLDDDLSQAPIEGAPVADVEGRWTLQHRGQCIIERRQIFGRARLEDPFQALECDEELIAFRRVFCRARRSVHDVRRSVHRGRPDQLRRSGGRRIRAARGAQRHFVGGAKSLKACGILFGVGFLQARRVRPSDQRGVPRRRDPEHLPHAGLVDHKKLLPSSRSSAASNRIRARSAAAGSCASSTVS